MVVPNTDRERRAELYHLVTMLMTPTVILAYCFICIPFILYVYLFTLFYMYIYLYVFICIPYCDN